MSAELDLSQGNIRFRTVSRHEGTLPSGRTLVTYEMVELDDLAKTIPAIETQQSQGLFGVINLSFLRRGTPPTPDLHLGPLAEPTEE